MSLPDAVRLAVETRFGPLQVEAVVGGGCIHSARRIATRSGALFLKFGHRSPPGFFAAEALGLRALAAASPQLRIPRVEAHEDADEGDGYGWIVMEWIEAGRGSRDNSERLADGLAQLHEPAPGGWGWERDGFIGTLPQQNRSEERWADFWWRRRLEPQLALARSRGRIVGGGAEWTLLRERLPELLSAAEEEGASLLHGDLWSGNILATSSGPALVDPAAYRGHREVDLAMGELFGGVEPAVLDRYESHRPLRPGYRESRRAIYQLYYLLVHVNLFGEGYLAPTAATLRSVLARL